jgi:hypothetical protein
MKVIIRTRDKAVSVIADESATTVGAVDEWIKALRVAREWLRKELEPCKPKS